ncbi:hypothetical protein [Vibrio chemaguriensis]
MGRSVWDFAISEPHVVSVEHGFFSGKAVIRLDGEVIFKRKSKFFDTGHEHRFTVDEKKCIVRIIARTFHFTYELWVDGKLE